MDMLALVSDTRQQTYMSTIITAKVADMVEMKNDKIHSIDDPLVTT